MSEEPTTPDLVERVHVIQEAADRADFDTILQFYRRTRFGLSRTRTSRSRESMRYAIFGRSGTAVTRTSGLTRPGSLTSAAESFWG
jgi:hypothetical protein